MLTVYLTYKDGSSQTVKVYAQSQFLDLADFYEAESAEIISYERR